MNPHSTGKYMKLVSIEAGRSGAGGMTQEAANEEEGKTKEEEPSKVAPHFFVSGDLDLYEENFGVTLESDNALLSYRSPTILPADADLSDSYELLVPNAPNETNGESSTLVEPAADEVARFQHFSDYDEILALREAVENFDSLVQVEAETFEEIDDDSVLESSEVSRFFDETGLMQAGGFVRKKTSEQAIPQLQRPSELEDLNELRAMLEKQEDRSPAPTAVNHDKTGASPVSKFVRDLAEIEALRSAIDGYGKPWSDPREAAPSTNERNNAIDDIELEDPAETRRRKKQQELEEIESLRLAVESADFNRIRAVMEDAEMVPFPQEENVRLRNAMYEQARAHKLARDLEELEALRSAVEDVATETQVRQVGTKDEDFDKMMASLEQAETDDALRSRISKYKKEQDEIEALRAAVEDINERTQLSSEPTIDDQWGNWNA